MTWEAEAEVLETDDVNAVTAAELSGADKVNTLGFYDIANKKISMNTNYTDVDKMNKVYDNNKGFHPSRGNKTGTEAVALHETGHALTGHIAAKRGMSFDAASEDIVRNAYKKSGTKKSVKAWAKSISGYATQSNHECIAEAVADVYCNGSKASAASIAIVNEMRRYA